MAKTIPMPPKEELPDGPRRAFVIELRSYYRVARPTLRQISKAVDDHEDPRVKKVTASAETVRRMITGKVLPEQARLYAVFRVLCDMAEIDPDADHWEGRYDDEAESHWQYIRRLWDTALEEADSPPLPRPTPPPPDPQPTPARQSPWPANDDPWSSESAGYSDEPPF